MVEETLESAIAVLRDQYRDGNISEKLILDTLRKYDRSLDNDFVLKKGFLVKLEGEVRALSGELMAPMGAAGGGIQSVTRAAKKMAKLASDATKDIKEKRPTPDRTKQVQGILALAEAGGTRMTEGFSEFGVRLLKLAIPVAAMDEAVRKILSLRRHRIWSLIFYRTTTLTMTVCFYAVSFIVGYKLDFAGDWVNGKYFHLTSIVPKILVFVALIFLIDRGLTRIKQRVSAEIIYSSVNRVIEIDRLRENIHLNLQVCRTELPEIEL